MKKVNKYLILLATAVFTLTACEKDIQREPSPVFDGAKAVYFPVSELKREVDPKEVYEQKVVICRDSANKASELAVKLNVVKNTSKVFELPATITFPAGQSNAELLIKFPGAQIDSTYNLVIELDPEVSNPYSTNKPTFSLVITIAKWNDVTDKKAIVFDGITNIFYGVGVPGWYVPYQRKDNSDGSFDIRLLNPYTILPEYEEGEDGKPDYDAPIADKFGLYRGYPYNYPEDVDPKGTYNMVIHVAKNGSATFDQFQLGMAWSDGAFFGAHAPSKGQGKYDSDAQSITFPAGSVLCALAAYNAGAFYSGNEDMVVFLDSALWQDEHSAITIASLDDGFNDASIQWQPVAGKLKTLVSEIESSSFDVALGTAIDPNVKEKQGPGSDFYNLFQLADVYAKGYGLAFYWDSIKGKISLPVGLQPMGKTFASKKIFLGPSAENESYVEEIDLKGDKVTVFHFFLQVQTKDGGNLGEFEEVFYLGPNEVVWTEEDYLGNFILTGKSLFAGYPDAEMPVRIAKEGNDMFIVGVELADTIHVNFDADAGTMAILPQYLGDLINEGDTLDVLFLTYAAGGPSDTEPLIFSYGLDGLISLVDESPAFGYLLYSDAVGDFLDGYFNLQLAPAPEAKASPKAKAVTRKTSLTKPVLQKKNGFKLQGKLERHPLRIK